MEEMQTVRWGILGAGGIAHRFARSLATVPGTRLVAISCRNPGKAQAFAEEFGVEHVFAGEAGAGSGHEGQGHEGPGHEGSGHEQLIGCEDVDAIYLALPHGLHLLWAERALRAGKAVLCEKPAALSAAEVREIVRVARETGTLFVEAMKTRFEPAYLAVKELVALGAIGEIVRVEARLVNNMPREAIERSSYYLDPVQGGVLLDTGIYCASWIDDLLPGAVEVVRARADLMGEVDSYDIAELSVGGVEAVLECAFDRPGPREAVITGVAGHIVVPDLHRPERARVERAGEEPRELVAPYDVDDFRPEIVHVTELVRAGAKESPVVPHASSIRMAEILDAVRAAIR